VGGRGDDGPAGRSVNSKNACVRHRCRWVRRAGSRRTPGRRHARGDVDRAPACRRIDSFRTGVKTPLTTAERDAFSRF